MGAVSSSSLVTVTVVDILDLDQSGERNVSHQYRMYEETAIDIN
jgi:hypothetical protein